VFYVVLRFFLNIFYVIFFRFKVVGSENIPKTGAAIIASNHVSLLDPPTLGVACGRPIHFMAKSELFTNPLFSFLIRKLGAFPVRRGMGDYAAVKKALAILNGGEVLGIFPEGTRSKDGRLGKAGPGVMVLAGRAAAVVVPTAIIGTGKISWRNPFPQITVAFGRPLVFPEKTAEQVVLQQRAEQIMSSIQMLLVNE